MKIVLTMPTLSFEAVRSKLRSYLVEEHIWDDTIQFYSGLRSEEELYLETYRLVFNAGLLPTFSDLSQKSKELSEQHRLAGNNAFLNRDDLKAIQKYTQAVGHAPWKSKELALAYANRSAVTHSIGEDLDCVRDIDAALSTDYPNSLKYKILERKGKSLLRLGDNRQATEAFTAALEYLPMSGLSKDKMKKIRIDIEDTLLQCNIDCTMREEIKNHQCILPNLKLGPSPTIESASSSIDIKYSDEMGRHVVATADIKPGDVLAIERPYASVLLPNSYSSHCFHCKKRCHSLQPCAGCTKAMFCSHECSKKCWEESHSVECSLLAPLLSLGSYNMELLAVRILLQATKQGSELVQVVDSLNKLESFESPLMKGFKNGKYPSRDYISTHNLIGNQEKRKPCDLLGRAVTSVCIVEALDECTDFFSKNSPIFEEMNSHYFEKANRLKAVVGGLILRYLQSMPCNAHEVSEMCITRKRKINTHGEDVENNESNSDDNSKRDVQTESNEIGGAVYPFLSLINHSCDPNVVRHSYIGDLVVLTAIQVIKTGEQIFDNYGYHHAVHSLHDRRNHLESQYYFRCNCTACVEDWSLYADLPNQNPSYLPGANIQVFEEESEKFHKMIKDILAGDTENKLPFLYYHLNLLHTSLRRPWKDYSACQEAIKQCLSLKANHYIVNT